MNRWNLNLSMVVGLAVVLNCAAATWDKVDITIRNESGVPAGDPSNLSHPVVDSESFDVIVMGGGLAGLSSALYLTDAGKKVLLLEREEHLGGLASFGSSDGIHYSRGAAYWTDPYEEEDALLKRIGLGNYRKANPIPEPVDSYYVRGQYFKGIWDEETVAALPASFALFKFALLRLSEEGKIPNQPMEEAATYGANLALDHINSRQWIERMPRALKRYADDPKSANRAEAQKILERFQQESRAHKLRGKTGMEGVVELLDLYCRSALGGNTDDVSAVALANFYMSEIITRYTSPEGTGVAALNMVNELALKTALFRPLTSAPVIKVKSLKDGVQVTYNLNGSAHVVKAGYAVFAMQLRQAPKLIEDFARKAPLQAAAMNGIGYMHYAVHNVYVTGQPYRAAYDTWTRAKDYSEKDFSDVILGQWMEPSMLGYQGYRDFKVDPPVEDGVFSIYHPIAKEWTLEAAKDGDMGDAVTVRIARHAVKRLAELYPALPSDLWQGSLEFKQVVTSRWPFSIHTSGPGYFINKVRLMRKPFGRVFFAHNNLGTPSIEEALFRGHCAADNILLRISPTFAFEKWTRCPLERK